MFNLLTKFILNCHNFNNIPVDNYAALMYIIMTYARISF